MGNAYTKQGDFNKALDLYETSLGEHNNQDVQLKKRDLLKKLGKSTDLNNNNNSTNKNLDESIRKRLNRKDWLLSESEVRALKKPHEATTDQTFSFNKMTEMLSSLFPNSPKFNIFDSRVQPYELDSYPAGCDPAKCNERLRSMYETTRSIQLHQMHLKSDDFKPDMMDYVRRLGNNCPETLDWYFKASEGEINRFEVAAPYDPRVLHSYSNEPVRSEILTAGTSHVAVGFTDLGMIHSVKFLDEWTEDNPLKWVGYEASAYCVAKTAVIVGMVESGAGCDEIVQVWYSAAWSFDALKAFRAAIGYLLNSKLGFFLSFWGFRSE